jgi:hypothetical protein
LRQQPVAGLQAPSGDIGGKGIRQLHVVGTRHYCSEINVSIASVQ